MTTKRPICDLCGGASTIFDKIKRVTYLGAPEPGISVHEKCLIRWFQRFDEAGHKVGAHFGAHAQYRTLCANVHAHITHTPYRGVRCAPFCALGSFVLMWLRAYFCHPAQALACHPAQALATVP